MFMSCENPQLDHSLLCDIGQGSLSLITKIFFIFLMRPIEKQRKLEICALLRQEVTLSEVAKHFGISVSTVYKIKKEYNIVRRENTGGRPQKLSKRDKNMMLRKILSGEVDTAEELVRSMPTLGVSSETARRVLKNAGLAAAVKIKKPMLSLKNRKARLHFAKSHQHWTVEDWKKIIFSDETKINRLCSDGKKWCWKFPRSGLSDRVIDSTLKHGGGSMMAWGCFCYSGVGHMAKIDGTMDAELYCAILRDEFMSTLSFYDLDPEKIILQHDNDPKHTAKKTSKWLEDNEIRVLSWPAQSPDLNPIEHMWAYLKQLLAKYPELPSGINELWERVQKVWEAIPVDLCVRLIESMPPRVAAVLKAKGGHTKY